LCNWVGPISKIKYNIINTWCRRLCPLPRFDGMVWYSGVAFGFVFQAGHCWVPAFSYCAHVVKQWHQCKSSEGSGRLWKKCSQCMKMGGSSLLGKDQQVEMGTKPVCHRALLTWALHIVICGVISL